MSDEMNFDYERLLELRMMAQNRELTPEEKQEVVAMTESFCEGLKPVVESMDKVFAAMAESFVGSTDSGSEDDA